MLLASLIVTVSITLSFSPGFVIVLASVIVTVSLCPLTSVPLDTIAASLVCALPSYTNFASTAVTLISRAVISSVKSASKVVVVPFIATSTLKVSVPTLVIVTGPLTTVTVAPSIGSPVVSTAAKVRSSVESARPS